MLVILSMGPIKSLVEYLKYPSDFQPLLLLELIVSFYLPCEFLAR
jgi:hypothetical protein